MFSIKRCPVASILLSASSIQKRFLESIASGLKSQISSPGDLSFFSNCFSKDSLPLNWVASLIVSPNIDFAQGFCQKSSKSIFTSVRGEVRDSSSESGRDTSKFSMLKNKQVEAESPFLSWLIRRSWIYQLKGGNLICVIKLKI